MPMKPEASFVNDGNTLDRSSSQGVWAFAIKVAPLETAAEATIPFKYLFSNCASIINMHV